MYIFHAVERSDVVKIFYDKTGLKLNILIPYNYIKGNSSKLTDLNRDYINLLYLDSGAYSVHTGKSKIDVYGYRDYLNEYGHKFDACFNLDDRFNDPDHNLSQQLYLESGLLNSTTLPIPVIHDKKNPLGEFEMYAELGHSFIAIGSSGSYASKDKLLTQAKEKYPDVKIHLFGDLDRKLLYKHRPYSADASTWVQEAARGCIYYWQPQNNKEYEYNVGERENVKGKHHIKLSPHWDEIRSFIHDTFGYENKDLFKLNVRFILNLYFFTQLENYLNSLDGK